MKKYLLVLCVIAVLLAGVFVAYERKNTAPSDGNIPFSNGNPAPIDLTPHPVAVSASETVTFQAPEDVSISLAASGLGRARFMAKSPDGRLFVTDMHDLSDNSLGKIYILDGFSEATHSFATTTVYLDHLRNPNSVAFATDSNGDSWIYVALTDRLIRYPYHTGDTHPSGEPTVLARYPDYGLSYKYGGWHLTRTIAIHGSDIYVSIGSSCNSCEENEALRASIWKSSSGEDFMSYATGLRNAVGLKFVGDDLYATDMGADQYGSELPKEKLYRIQEGANYGWPYCLQGDGKVLAASTTVWTKQFDCSTVPNADAVFDAHAAPLGLEYFSSAYQIPELKDSFLVALHGASTPSIGHGYSIVRVGKKDSKAEDFITGFLTGTTNDSRIGRPVDILINDSHSFFFTDDLKGRLYFVSLK